MASASADETKMTHEVAYAGTNFSVPQERAELDRRVVRSAHAVCEDRIPPTGSMLPRGDSRKCYREAVADARAQIAAAVERAGVDLAFANC